MSLITTSENQAPTTIIGLILPRIPPLDHILNIITLYLISSLFLFSLFSLLLIIYLRLLSRRRRHIRLHTFALHSSSRLLLVSLISLWSFSELLRLHLLPPLSTPLQIQLCKLHHVISLGLLEPAFLASLLFLLNTSLSPRTTTTTTHGFFHALSFILTFSSPVCIALYLATYHLHARVPLPGSFFHNVAFFDDRACGCRVVLCTYPILSAAVFGVFSVVYAVALLFKSWQVISMAINKRLASRINVLSFTLLMCLAVQVVLMSLSVFLTPIGAMYYFLIFLIFSSVVVSAIVGEGILVIIPILDALSTVVVVADEEEMLDE